MKVSSPSSNGKPETDSNNINNPSRNSELVRLGQQIKKEKATERGLTMRYAIHSTKHSRKLHTDEQPFSSKQQAELTS